MLGQHDRVACPGRFALRGATHWRRPPDRAASAYRAGQRAFGVSYLSCQNGWVVGTWLIGNSYRRRTNYYGGFQGNFLRRIHALFPDRRRVLHLFSGRVDTAAFPGDTLDINPELEPTYCANAETCEGVRLYLRDFVLADPPYSKADAPRYGTKLPASRKVMAALAAGLPWRTWVVWLDRRRPMYRKEDWCYEAAIGIEGSTYSATIWMKDAVQIVARQARTTSAGCSGYSDASKAGAPGRL